MMIYKGREELEVGLGAVSSRLNAAQPSSSPHWCCLGSHTCCAEQPAFVLTILCFTRTREFANLKFHCSGLQMVSTSAQAAASSGGSIRTSIHTSELAVREARA